MASDKAELRQLAPAALLVALDAIAMSKGMERHTYIEKVLEADVKRVAHEASVICRVLRGNPYLSETSGGGAE